MPKRPYDDNAGQGAHKKHRPDHYRPAQHDRYAPPPPKQEYSQNQSIVPRQLPPLPQILDKYSAAPFTHRSAAQVSRSVAGNNDLSYERLEFLGDAYLEMFSSKLIFERFHHLPAGQMSQMREILVKNETLAEYSRAYGFDKRIDATDLYQMQVDSKKGNKGYNKVLGDVFEAYVAAVVLSDPKQDFGTAEKWVVALWEPKIKEAVERDQFWDSKIATVDVSDPRRSYNDQAKAVLQKRILGNAQVKLSYEPYKDMVELKGAKLGQNRHYIALYLTGYGYDKKLLGKGEGKNKVEAGNWAAIEAMYGDTKDIVDECEKMMKADKERKSAQIKKEKEDDGEEEKPKVKKEVKDEDVSDGDESEKGPSRAPSSMSALIMDEFKQGKQTKIKEEPNES